MSYTSGSSRMSTLSNLRRGVGSDRSESSSHLQDHQTRSNHDLNEGLSIDKAPAPSKPPKPSAFRVKKAKALSISLLTGGGSLTASSNVSQDHDYSKSSSVDGASTSRWRSSRLFAPQSAALSNKLLSPHNDRNDSSPFRPQSAMDYYRSHGPSKGLASPGWRDNTEGKESIANQRGSETGNNSVSNIVKPSEGLLLPSNDLKKSPQYQLHRTQSPSTASLSDPHTNPSKTDRSLQEWKRESRGFSRSQSSLGLHQSADSRSSSQSSLSLSAMARVNSARDRDQLESEEGLQSPQNYMAAPSPLGNSHIVSSAPVTPAYCRPDALQSASKGHSRTSSTASAILPGFVSSLPIPKVASRNRAQSHATVSPTRLRAQLPAVPPSKDGQPMLAPPRHRYSKGSLQEGLGGGLKVQQGISPRSSSPFGPASPLHALGQQLGGLGAAVGKRGWDMMKSWNQGISTQGSSPSNLAATPHSTKNLLTNEATRIWNASPDPTSMIPVRGGVRRDDARQAEMGAIFGKSLRAAVIQSRLAGATNAQKKEEKSQLYALDLGSEFSINLPNLESLEVGIHGRKVIDRMDARKVYLPAIIVRCIQAIEKWGPSEEGIYRLSGRTSHTAKLKSIFDQSSTGIPLQLSDIGPADLDLNSICSVLKAYLRALPETMLTSELSPLFNEAIKDASGQSLIGDLDNIRQSEQINAEEAKMQSSNLIQRIANAITPLMKKLPSVNWYLLREIAMHLGDLTREETVQQTKMPLSNLCLVLAPTLSLSVVVVRTFVEERELIFGQSFPLPDEDLDPVMSERKADSARRNDQDSQMSGILPSIRQGSQMPDDWDLKRASVATVKALDNFDKRISTSSVATVQRGQQSNKSDLRMTSKLPFSSVEMSNTSSSPMIHRSTSPEEIMEEVDAPPIAAHYIHVRKRSSSLANSMFSIQSNEYSPTNLSPHINKMPSSISLYSIAAQGSTMDSSLPSSTDQDSPNTTDDDWPNTRNYDPSRKTLHPSSSSTSVNSLNKRSAIDRPRPITPHASHFFSR